MNVLAAKPSQHTHTLSALFFVRSRSFFSRLLALILSLCNGLGFFSHAHARANAFSQYIFSFVTLIL